MALSAREPGDYSLTLPPELAGLRLDQALARLLPDYSRSRIQSWIESGQVRVNGRPAIASSKVWGGEFIELVITPHPAERPARPEAIALDIVHEDDSVLVLNKPPGLVVHPGHGNWAGTLMNALLHHAAELAHIPRAGIVHRLDKDTSGLMVVARTLTAQTHLVRQLQARTVGRDYLALVQGEVVADGEVEAPVGRHPRQRTKMAVIHGGRPASTRYRIVERFPFLTLVACTLATGRTHQIRVHMAHIGHPLIGDPVYGARSSQGKLPEAVRRFHRQALHAYRLGLIHPATGERLQWEAPLPADFAALIAALRKDARDA
jgi:23S rRNA pseudouridine1911/1915/1917 synthase